jgi:hypothetical protein
LKIEFPFYGLLIVLSCLLFDNKKQQSAVWLAPYFSGAANLGLDLSWKYSVEDCIQFKELEGQEKANYRFKRNPKEELKSYDFNSKGLLYCSFIARNTFFWAGDLKSIEYLHITVFLFLNLLIISSFKILWQRLAFLFLFSLNPFIIHFVTFPYSFFWQIIPSIAAIYLIITKKPIISSILLFGLLIGLSMTSRPSTMFISFGFFALLFLRNNISIFGKTASFIIFILVVSTLATNTKKNPWFTMFVGVGAYKNDHVLRLSDNEGYDHFEKVTGIPINASFNGNYYEEDIQEQFYSVFKKSFLQILKNSPFLLLKNSLVNIFQGYSIGYINGQPDWINYLISASGFVFFIFLIAYRQFLIVLLILLNNVGFSPYYPPIQAYMYGAYPLLVIGSLAIIAKRFNLSKIPNYFFIPIYIFNKWKRKS